MTTSGCDRPYIRGTGRSPKREITWVAEYLAGTFPRAIIHTQLRLPCPPDARWEHQGADFGPGQGPVKYRVADAVVIEDGKITLIEGAFTADLDKVLQLILYDSLLPHCPDLHPYSGNHLRLAILTAVASPGMRELCRVNGVEYWVYSPPWVKKHLLTLRRRDRRPPDLPVEIAREITFRVI